MFNYVNKTILQVTSRENVYKDVHKIMEYMILLEIMIQEFVINIVNKRELLQIHKHLIDIVSYSVLKALLSLLLIPLQNHVFPNAQLILLFLDKLQHLLVWHNVKIHNLLIPILEDV